ncbi:MAG: hypothetical protein PSW75_08500 [bacterium]|nr:hypothetical protein [bacterium]MDI1334989.1 hypothetical protein [Lacunisphaera sp.]
MHPRLLLAASLLVLLVAGCATAPVIEPPGTATIRGSEDSSALFDNFTAFIAAVDGQPVAAGRAGWNTPVELKAGHRILTVEFKRGVFSAKAQLELQAVAHASYQLKYATDAQLFGKNSFCDFWITDLATSQPLTGVVKAPVVKGG